MARVIAYTVVIKHLGRIFLKHEHTVQRRYLESREAVFAGL